MVNLLDTNNIKYLQNTKRQIKSESTGNALELDFFLLDYKVAIECHGLYWHSDAKSLKVSQRTPEIINENSLYIRRVLREKYYACKDQDINLLISPSLPSCETLTLLIDSNVLLASRTAFISASPSLVRL